jgi:hypothetical protein
VKKGELAALELALAVLRKGVLRQPNYLRDEWNEDAEYHVGTASEVEVHGLEDDLESPCFLATELVEAPSGRILRARLALTLRALLRAERGSLLVTVPADTAVWSGGIRGGEDMAWHRGRSSVQPWLGWVTVWPVGNTVVEVRAGEPHPDHPSRLAVPLWSLARHHRGAT